MLTGKGLVDYSKGKVGTPYFFGAKMETLTNSLMATMHRLYPGTVTDSYMRKAKEKGQVGKVNVDCSGLIGAYRGKQIGSAQLYQTAYTRLSIKDYKKWADGVTCWRSGHVGVFANENDEYVVYEAKGIDYGTVRSIFNPTKWTCGLTFSDIDYIYDEKADTTWKAKNPFAEPLVNIKRGMKGNDVKWVQFELSEAGKSFAVLKVTKKNNEIEDAFERNYRGCRSVQMPIAVYRYVYATSLAKAEEEARAIVDVLRTHPIEGEVWLDMEDKSIAGIGKSALTLIIDQEAKILKAAGYKVGIYCNKDWFYNTLEGNELSKRYRFWIAKYGENDGTWQNRDDCPKSYAYAWQYSNCGKCPGVNGDCDLDLIF